MALTDAEIEDLRYHLGYGNIGVGAYPHTGDGFYEVFFNVVQPYLQEGDSTSSLTAVTASTITQVIPLSMTGIVASAQLVVDVGDDAEIVWVKSVLPSSFFARFAKAHSGDGYPIMVNSGAARCRYMLNEANKAWAYIQSEELSKIGNLKGIGRKEVEWWSPEQAGGSAVDRAIEHYRRIVDRLSQLVRIPPAWGASSGSTRLEAY
jgi:hypothetical protein